MRLLEGGSKGQSSAEPARRRGSHIPIARRLEPVHVALFQDPVSAGEAVLGEGDLSPGTRVLIVRGPPGHRTLCEGRGGEGRDAATHQGAPKVTQPQEEAPPEAPEGARPCSHLETAREFTWAISGHPAGGPSLQQPQETNARPARLQKLSCSEPFGSPGRAQRGQLHREWQGVPLTSR